MANSRQIREWAREQNLPVSDAGPIATDIRRAYREAHEENPAPEVSLTDEAPPFVEEVAPKVAAEEPVIARVISRAKKTTRAPRGRKMARNSVAHILGFVYSGMAAPVSKVSPPVAYMMTVQSEVAGAVLDPVVAGTMVDKILQPFARVSEKMEPINALLTPLVCVALMERFPEQMPRIEQQLRKSLASWARISKPHYDAIKEAEEKFTEEFGEDIDQVIESVKNVILLTQMQKEQATAAESWG